MPAERDAVDSALLYGFLLVLARVGGALVFVPLPGSQGRARSRRGRRWRLGFTLALFARWPAVEASAVAAGCAWRPGRLRKPRWESPSGWRWRSSSKRSSLAAQMLGLQAGYAYASTIDPNTEADSGVLLVFAQLMAGLLFFALGLDREILRLFAAQPGEDSAGHLMYSGPAAAEAMIRLGASLFSVGRAAGPAGGRAAGAGGCGAGAARDGSMRNCSCCPWPFPSRCWRRSPC